MADRYPKALDDATTENTALRADVARLQASVASLQATLIQRDTEIANLRRPKATPRALDPQARDRFRRPAYHRRQFGHETQD